MDICLSTAYLPPVEYLSRIFRANQVWIEQYDHYHKQTYRNRCIITGPDGPLDLTVPVIKPEDPHTPMKDIRISDHGNWRHLHWNALCSAYNHSPFFEYYKDDFAPFYQQKWEYLIDYNEVLLKLICDLVGVEKCPLRTTSYQKDYPADWQDLRETIHPKLLSDYELKPYYQVFADKLGFIKNLSAVDLLFNMGPESIFYL